MHKKVEKLYYIYRIPLFLEAFEILQDKTLAEDAVSESFLRILNHTDGIAAIDCPETWSFLKIICRNAAIDIYRRNKRETQLINSAVISPLPQSPEDIILDRESVGTIMNIIANMDPIYKDVIILSRQYNLKTSDISHLLGISPDAVTKRLQRAKAEIRNKLAKEEAR
ncbi:MAG: RNA polymerase sigma factor [Clostridia bacterium]|nr:RNA polymerase sigma factor [Clostridia bacterium]